MLRSRALLLALLWLPAARAQTVAVGGYVKAEAIYDTRQVVQQREGQFSLYPLPVDSAGARGQDRNATDNLLLSAFQSRLSVSGAGVTALGAAAGALIEADFFGPTNASVSAFFLRRAFVRLDWGRAELLAGQEWSPLTTAEIAPQTVDLNGGAPFQPFARHPQLRLTWRPGSARVLVALSQQRDGFAEVAGAKLHQQAALPAAHAHVQAVGARGVVGAGVQVKAIRPTLTSARFTSAAATAYGRLAGGGAALTAKATYGSDLVDHSMPGGFVVTRDGAFVPLRLASGWIDVQTTRPLSVGVLAGLLVNLGSGGAVALAAQNAAAGTRAPDLASLWRLSPRLQYAAGKVRLAAEVEVTSARYAAAFDARYRPDPGRGDGRVANARVHLATFYTF